MTAPAGPGVRFWTLTPDPDVPEHPTGEGWVGIVDEQESGVVAWCHESRAAALINTLAYQTPPGSRLRVDVSIGDAWQGAPALRAARVTAAITHRLLEMGPETIGCDLSGVTPVYVDGECVGEWQVIL